MNEVGGSREVRNRHSIYLEKMLIARARHLRKPSIKLRTLSDALDTRIACNANFNIDFSRVSRSKGTKSRGGVDDAVVAMLEERMLDDRVLDEG